MVNRKSISSSSSDYRWRLWRPLSAKALSRVGVNVTLVDKRNFHLFQPLYQVATGTLSPLIFHPSPLGSE